jgi:hypothetical protein
MGQRRLTATMEAKPVRRGSVPRKTPRSSWATPLPRLASFFPALRMSEGNKKATGQSLAPLPKTYLPESNHEWKPKGSRPRDLPPQILLNNTLIFARLLLALGERATTRKSSKRHPDLWRGKSSLICVAQMYTSTRNLCMTTCPRGRVEGSFYRPHGGLYDKDDSTFSTT